MLISSTCGSGIYIRNVVVIVNILSLKYPIKKKKSFVTNFSMKDKLNSQKFIVTNFSMKDKLNSQKFIVNVQSYS